jgi:hypothetical protein
MSKFGDFSKTTFVNGTSPAINAVNLNKNEDMLSVIDTELAYSQQFNLSYFKDYWLARNYKQISLMDDASNWTAEDSTVSADTTNCQTSYAGIKVLQNDSDAGWVSVYRSITALDLTTFQNGIDASTTADVIHLTLYVSDITKVQTCQFKLGTDNSDNYTYVITGLATGWNSVAVHKSAFSESGTPPAWSNITYIRCEWASYASSLNAYITFDFLGMYRNDPDNSGWCGCFAVKDADTWVDSYLHPSELARLYFDPKFKCAGIGVIDNFGIDSDIGIKLQTRTYLNFICDLTWYCIEQDEISKIRWYYDASNYIDVYITSGTAYMVIEQSTGTITESQALPSTLTKGTKVDIRFEKNGTQARAIFKFSNQPTISLESETILDNAAQFYFMSRETATNYGFLADFKITHTQANIQDIQRYPRLVLKQIDESVTSSTTLQDDNEFDFTLERNGVYEIEAVLYVTSSSTTPDFKCLWVLGGGSSWKIGNMSSIRAGIGQGTGSTSSQGSDDINMSALGMGTYPTTAFEYGVQSATWSTAIIEKHIVHVSNITGTCKLQWAQNTSNGSATTLKGGSYVKITKLCG